MMQLPHAEKKYDYMWSRVDFRYNIGTCQTDGRTDGRTELLYQYRAVLCHRFIKDFIMCNTRISLLNQFVLIEIRLFMYFVVNANFKRYFGFGFWSPCLRMRTADWIWQGDRILNPPCREARFAVFFIHVFQTTPCEYTVSMATTQPDAAAAC